MVFIIQCVQFNKVMYLIKNLLCIFSAWELVGDLVDWLLIHLNSWFNENFFLYQDLNNRCVLMDFFNNNSLEVKPLQIYFHT